MSEGELRKQIYLLLPLCQGEEYKHCTPEHPSSICQRAVGGIMEIIAQQCAVAMIDELQYLEHAREEAIGPDKFISKYITKRVKKIVAPKAAPHDHNAPDGAERNV